MNMYQICFYGGLILMVILLVTSIVLFFVLKIPHVVGDLTGRTARKSIKEMSESKEKEKGSGLKLSKKEQSKYYNVGTGKITVKESSAGTSENLTEVMEEDTQPAEELTEVLGAGRFSQNAMAPVAEDGEELTDVLHGEDDPDEATDVLTSNDGRDDEATDILTSDRVEEDADAPTDILTTDIDEDADAPTDVLTSNMDADDAPTDVLTTSVDEFEADGETDVLATEYIADDAETDVLTAEDATAGSDFLTGDMAHVRNRIRNPKVRVIYNAVVTHSDEGL